MPTSSVDSLVTPTPPLGQASARAKTSLPSRATQSSNAPDDIKPNAKPTATVNPSVSRPSALSSTASQELIVSFLASRKRPADQSSSDATATTTTPDDPNCKKLRESLHLELERSGGEGKAKSMQTPDILSLLSHSTPEISKLIQNAAKGKELATPSPAGLFSPKIETSPQRQYAQGFLDALKSLHKLNGFGQSPTHLLTNLTPGVICKAVDAVEQKEKTASPTKTSTATSPLTLGSSNPLAFSPTVAINGSINLANLLQTIAASPALAHQLRSPGAATTTTAGSLASIITQTGSQAMLNMNYQQPHFTPQQQQQLWSQAQQPFNNTAAYVNAQSMPQQPGTSAAVQPAYATQYQDTMITNSRLRPASQTQPSAPSSVASVGPSTSAAARRRPSPAPSSASSMGSSAYHNDLIHPHNDQEAVKLERKRERNRLAASKCRQRKLDRISELEQLVATAKENDAKLDKTLRDLRDEITKLQRDYHQHRTQGCHVDKTE